MGEGGVLMPEEYVGRVSLITPGSGRCYSPADFQEGLEVLIYFARAKSQCENAIRRCRVLDPLFKKKRKGFGYRPALRVYVNKAWDIAEGRMVEQDIRIPITHFFYDNIKKVFRVD